MENYLYFLDEKPYINMTNACTNRCVFCIRNQKDDVQGAKLWLEKDDITSDKVIEQIKNNETKVLKAGEIVFCGYGEPLIKIRETVEVCKFLKKNYENLKIRINTNGHANAIHKRNVVPELASYIDSISISLNGENEEEYERISKPNLKNTYSAVKNFISECAKAGIDTTATVVSGYRGYEVDVKKCEEITKSLGAKFRERPWIENGY